MLQMLDMRDRLAVVTGGTRGIGRAIAAELAALGAEVLIVGRSEDRTRTAAAELTEAALEAARARAASALASSASAASDPDTPDAGSAADAGAACSAGQPAAPSDASPDARPPRTGLVVGVAADVATPEGRDAVVARALGRGGRVHVLVNNVGTNVRKPTDDFTADDLEHLHRINTTSAFELSRRLRPALAAAAVVDGDAAIINVSSSASRRVISTSTCAYSMSKAGLDAMTDWMSVEFGPQRIRVNAVHPWYIRTPLVDEVLEDDARREAIERATPLGRVGEPAEVGRVVAFLASPAAAYVSGAHVDVDGAFARSGLAAG